MSQDSEVQRGKQALEVLKNPAYLEAYETLDAALVKAWRDSKDSRDREDIHKMLGLLKRLHGILDSTVRNGQITEKEILRKNNLADRLLGR